ncbi:hypothetical protein K7432_007256 [Basidiobolus ranarum]|uniref:Uncharacterized protein n=1 Tax=Basidiobolus ranarum TaxID=34480 RepID=A0ABR2W0F1_9FUNG
MNSNSINDSQTAFKGFRELLGFKWLQLKPQEQSQLSRSSLSKDLGSYVWW